MSSQTAAAKVFAIPELLENIFVLTFNDPDPVCTLDMRWCVRWYQAKFLFTVQRVSRDFSGTIAGSLPLRRLMLLEHDRTTLLGFAEERWGCVLNPLSLLCHFGLSQVLAPFIFESSRGTVYGKLCGRTWKKRFSNGELPIQRHGSWRKIEVLDPPPSAGSRAILWRHERYPNRRTTFAELPYRNTFGDLADVICQILQTLQDERAEAEAEIQKDGQCEDSTDESDWDDGLSDLLETQLSNEEGEHAEKW